MESTSANMVRRLWRALRVLLSLAWTILAFYVLMNLFSPTPLSETLRLFGLSMFGAGLFGAILAAVKGKADRRRAARWRSVWGTAMRNGECPSDVTR
ncbi:MAG: hypothetical protein HY944_00185 [Gemmatimonadetes bacterium]|nr:hypothetical protein [Gemmatimonadota bacterium]